jgi:MADS-box transcription factor
MSIKSRSIFTPIDESRSILSQHWARSTADSDALKQEPGVRSQSVDVTVNRVKPPSPLQRSQTHNKNRNISLSSVDSFTPPSRTNSAQLSAGGGKRPVLKVQIPEEASDNGGSATAEDNSSPRSANATANARRNGGDHAGMVLPPPSPSASALLSAGASGPPNPFARPHPVTQPSQGSNASGSNNNSNNNNMIDTPVSALPSRFMNTDFLPSPSSFYPEWNYRGSDSNTLPSPLNFATPVVGTGPSFLDNGDRGGKRKSPEQDTDRDGSDSKRPKLDG